MVKNEYVQGLAGLVDTIIGVAGTAVDEARKTLDVVDEYVTKGAVVLTRVVDVIEGLNSEGGQPEPETPGRTYLADYLSKIPGFNRDFLRTLDLDALIDLYNKASKGYNEPGAPSSSGWAGIVDDVTAPVEETTQSQYDRELMVRYIVSKPSEWYTEKMLSTLSDGELEDIYNFLRAKYNNN